MVALPDIAAGRRIAEGAMVDRCRILRDRPGAKDDVLDRVTGRLVPPAGDEDLIYEGPCLIRETALDARRDEGGRTAHYRAWQARMPMDAPIPAQYDVLLVLLSSRDANLVGRRFRLTDVGMASMAVTRILLMEDEQGATVR